MRAYHFAIYTKNSCDDFLRNRITPWLCTVTKCGRAYSWPCARHRSQPECSIAAHLSNQCTPKFHSDSADVVALICLKDAKEGGDSLLVSTETIYNEMHAKCPDLLSYFFDPITTDRSAEIPKGMAPFMTIPPLNWHEGKLTVFYQRQYIDSARRFDTALRLTTTHKEALDYFDHLANDPSLHIKMRLEPGDMQFVYYHSQLHDRKSFVDWPDRENRRHLFWLWFSLLGDRALPECFKQRYESIEIGDRGGL